MPTLLSASSIKRFDARLRVDLVAGGPSVRCIKADAELPMGDRLHELAELVERPAGKAARAG